MNKRKRVFVTSLIVLLLILIAGLYTLFFTGKISILADFVTGPQEEVVASQTAQQVWDNALAKSDTLELATSSESGYSKMITLKTEADAGALYGKISTSKLKYIRRFLWDGQVPEDTEMTIWACSQGSCDKGANWVQMNGTDESRAVQQSLKEVEYVIYLSRNPMKLAAEEAVTLLSAAGKDIPLPNYGVTSDTLQTTQTEVGSVQAATTGDKKLYAHYFFNGVDQGRYLGALVDSSGMNSDIYFLAFLTDRTAFVSERERGRRLLGTEKVNTDIYKNIQLVQDLQARSEVKFVDEANSNRPVGDATLSIRAGDQETWIDVGKFISSMVSVAGKFSKKRNVIWVDDDELHVGAGLGSGAFGGHNLTAAQNTEVFKTNNKALEYLQESVRVKFEPYQGENYQVADDGVGGSEYANIMVNDQPKGDFVGVGVEISGKYSDLFYPIWISHNDVKVGPTEYKQYEFYKTCRNVRIRQDYICGDQTAAQNSADFWALDSAKALRGVASDPLEKEKVAVYVTVNEGGANPACDDFDQVSITPTEISMPPTTSYQFSGSALDQSGDPLSVALSYSTNGGTINGTGLYTASKIEGSFSVFLTSECGGDVSAQVTVDKDAEPPTPITPTLDSPSIFQIGLTAGYSTNDDSDDDSDVTPAAVPGWQKGSLLKTGADLFVLVVITILIVVGIVYLSSLLKGKEEDREQPLPNDQNNLE